MSDDEDLFVELMDSVYRALNKNVETVLVIRSLASVYYGTCKMAKMTEEQINEITKHIMRDLPSAAKENLH